MNHTEIEPGQMYVVRYWDRCIDDIDFGTLVMVLESEAHLEQVLAEQYADVVDVDEIWKVGSSCQTCLECDPYGWCRAWLSVCQLEGDISIMAEKCPFYEEKGICAGGLVVLKKVWDAPALRYEYLCVGCHHPCVMRQRTEKTQAVTERIQTGFAF